MIDDEQDSGHRASIGRDLVRLRDDPRLEPFEQEAVEYYLKHLDTIGQLGPVNGRRLVILLEKYPAISGDIFQPSKQHSEPLPATQAPPVEKNASTVTPASANGNIKTTEEVVRQMNRPGLDEILRLSQVKDGPHVYLLSSYLKLSESPLRPFCIPDALHHTFGWNEKRLQRTRRRMIELGLVEMVRKPKKGLLGLYRWK